MECGTNRNYWNIPLEYSSAQDYGIKDGGLHWQTPHEAVTNRSRCKQKQLPLFRAVSRVLYWQLSAELQWVWYVNIWLAVAGIQLRIHKHVVLTDRQIFQCIYEDFVCKLRVDDQILSLVGTPPHFSLSIGCPVFFLSYDLFTNCLIQKMSKFF